MNIRKGKGKEKEKGKAKEKGKGKEGEVREIVKMQLFVDFLSEIRKIIQ
jgi:hypothetical protein